MADPSKLSRTRSSNPSETRSARFWTLFILGLIGINFFMAGLAIVLAMGDRSFRPMPSYGEQAVDWETHKKLLTASDSLGWIAEIRRSPTGGELQISLRDREGTPVTGGLGSITAYHFTSAGDPQTAEIVESETLPGTYTAVLDLQRDGRWQVLVQLHRTQQEQFFLDREFEWYR